MIPEAAYAMLACARLGAIHSVVFGGFSPDAIAGRIDDATSRGRDHSGRGSARRPQGAAEGQCRRSAKKTQPSSTCWSSNAPAARSPGRGRDVWLHEAAEPSRRLPGRAHGRGRPAVHPLHLRLDRHAQGRRSHHRRLSRLCRDDASVRLRLPRGRHLLVHGRRRLGHRPQLHRLRPARERRDHADVRRHSELSDDEPVLGGDRQAQGQYLLHRADRDPLADGRGRRAGEEDQPRLTAPARFGRRTDQPGGLGVVSPRRRRSPLPDRRHLVADRDRRHPDHAAARRDQAEAGLGDAAVLRRRAGDRRRHGQHARRRLRGQSGASPIPGPASCARSTAITSAS